MKIARLVSSYPEYAGMSYEQASREAERLVLQGWFKNFDRISDLKRIMDESLRRDSRLKNAGW